MLDKLGTMELNTDTSMYRGAVVEIEEKEMIEVAAVERIVAPSRTETGIIDMSNDLEITSSTPPRKILLRIRATGQYLQKPTMGNSGAEGDVLDSIEDASLFMEEVRAMDGSKIVFLVRMYFERGNQRYYLSYNPGAGNGARVQFNTFPTDPVTSDRLDPRWFVRRDYGNYTMLGSVFQDNRWLFYDTHVHGLTMSVGPTFIKILRVLRQMHQFQFSIEDIESRRRRGTMPTTPKRNINMFSHLSACFKSRRSTLDTA